MRCDEIMKINPDYVSPDDTAQRAAEIMRDDNLGFLPVCDEHRRVMGTITDRDLAIRVVADARNSHVRLHEVMTRQVIACRPEDEVRHAADLMVRNRKSRIMCIDRHGVLVGVISLSDLADADADNAVNTMRGVSEREAHV